EVDVMVNTLSSRTKNQKKLLASMRGEDPNLIDVELSDLEKKLESKDLVKSDSKDTKENDKPKKKKFSFFKRKKKK
ncbi:MAG: hypothetical protein HOK88_02660, partial [Candidatus Marinimicrobia bacterium]|nr:hypothetical protein [Candidatus Neomarinimicrobiota bacterium]